MKLSLLCSAMLALSACVAEPSTGEQVGNADERHVVPAEVGASYEFVVEAQRQSELGPRHYKALRVELEAGQSVAAVMRTSDGSDLDPYLALYLEPEREPRAKSDGEQGLVPMAAARDAVIVWRADKRASYLLFAADVDLDTSGAFQIDVVAL